MRSWNTPISLVDPENQQWVQVVLGLLINLCLGAAYSWSVFVGPLLVYFTTTLNLSVTECSVLLPFSVFLACLSIAMFFVGKYTEIYGPQPVAIVGGVLTGIGWVLSSFSTSPQMLILSYGIVGGLGTGITYSVPLAVVARWFPNRRGFAIGLTVLGFGLSTLFMANISGYLIDTYGVMSTFRILGLVFMCLITLLASHLVFPPLGWMPQCLTQQITPTSKKQQGSLDLTVTQMVRTSAFYGLWGCYFIGCFVGLMAIGIAKPVGMDVGLTSALATQLLGIFAISNSIGRPIFGTITDTLTPQKSAIISFILIAGASLGLSFVPTPVMYILSFAILWGCFGGWLAIAPTACGNYFGMQHYSRCYGVIFLAYGVGGITGPLLAGLIKTQTGSYFSVFLYIFILSIIGLIFAVTLIKPPITSENTTWDLSQ